MPPFQKKNKARTAAERSPGDPLASVTHGDSPPSDSVAAAVAAHILKRAKAPPDPPSASSDEPGPSGVPTTPPAPAPIFGPSVNPFSQSLLDSPAVIRDESVDVFELADTLAEVVQDLRPLFLAGGVSDPNHSLRLSPPIWELFELMAGSSLSLLPYASADGEQLNFRHRFVRFAGKHIPHPKHEDASCPFCGTTNCKGTSCSNLLGHTSQGLRTRSSRKLSS